MFGASDNTIGYANDYLVIYAIGTVFVMIGIGMNAFISAQGFTKISMVSVLIGAILNCILDPIFIFAFSMGVKEPPSLLLFLKPYQLFMWYGFYKVIKL